jgi:Secretory lipase
MLNWRSKLATRMSSRQPSHVRCALVFAASVVASLLASPSRSHAETLQGDGRVPQFYQSQEKLPSRPGILLKHETLEAELGINGAGLAYRLLYTSTDGNSDRDIVAVSGALFLPAGKPPQGGWPLVAWAHGTVGIADICAPSVQGRSLRDVTYLRRWLSEGFAVVATDYQGLGVPGPHLYLNTRSEAYSVIDSIRAAEQGFPNLSHQAIIVGQSQGGQAAFAAAVFAGK